MRCEICGKEREFLLLTETEGTKLLACQNCSSYGKVIKKVVEPKKGTDLTATITDLNTERPRRSSNEPTNELVQNYAEVISKARQKSGLTQSKFAAKIYEKESIVHRIEKGKMHPNESTAKKIENLFKVKLFEEIKLVAAPTAKKTNDLTLADMIKDKRKK